MTVSGESDEVARTCHQLGGPADGGILYKACDGASVYKSMDGHRSASGTKHQKSIWAESWSRAEECHIFCEAKIEQWSDKNGDCWSVAKENQYYGTRREKVAFFDAPQNNADPWHGYPVGNNGLPIRRRPPDELLQLWQDSNRISFVTFKRLHREVI